MTITDRAKVKLVYQATKNFKTATGMEQAFGLNYVYQPGNFAPLSDATNSALGQKSWSAWYASMICGGSKIEVSLVNNIQRAGVGEAPVWFTLTPWTQATLAADNTDVQPFMRTPYNKHKLIPLNCSIPQRLKHFMSVKKLEGKGRCIDDENFWSRVSIVANGFDGTPVQKSYWHLGVWNADAGADNIDITYTVKITYYCTLFQRWQLAT